MTQDCSYNELFALQVTDESMAPEFPQGCIIVIEPSGVCANGAYVVATVNGDRWFRQYLKDAQGVERLVACNGSHPDIHLAGTRFQIEGVIIQRTLRGEKTKHYRPYEPNNGLPGQ
ncbi:MAG: S24 family peptidase [Candidatus Sedimenticola endophacoides]